MLAWTLALTTYNVVSGAAEQCAVALEAMLIEPVLAPLCAGCDAVGQYETSEFALEIAKQLQVRP